MDMRSTCRRSIAMSIALMISVAACNSLATSCVDYSLKENFERMDVVFTGTVKDRKKVSKEESRRINWGPEFSDTEVSVVQLRFKVHEVWKGKLDRTVSLYTMSSKKSSFGYDFKDNGKYVVFAHFNKPQDKDEGSTDVIWTSWCSQNLELGSESRRRKQSSDRLRAFLVENDPSRKVLEVKNPFLRGVDDNNELYRQLAALKSNAEQTNAKSQQAGNENEQKSQQL